MAAVVTGASAGTAADDSEPIATVLVIQLASSGYVPLDRITGRMQSALRERTDQRVDVQTEFLDVMMSRGEEYDRAVLEYVRRKYSGARIVAVAGVGAQGATMALRIRDAVFADAPVLYVALDRKVAQMIDFGGNATGVTSSLDVPGTTALAMRLLPATEHAAVVLGASDTERPWQDRVVEEVQAAAPGVDVIPLFGLEKEELLRRVSTLPPQSVLIWVSYRRDPRGMTFTSADVLTEVRRAASAPVFGVFEYDFGAGIVGGRLVDLERQGDVAGALAARIVNGERAGAIPPVVVTDNPIRVDWREILHWHIDPRLLPPDSAVSFREPTAWDLYKGYVLGGVAVIALQGILIAALVAHRTRLLRAKRALAERLRFERFLGDMSARFADLPHEQIDVALAEGVAEIRAMYDADRAALVQFAQRPARFAVVHGAVAEGVEAVPRDLDTADLQDLVEHVGRGESLQYSRPAEIPLELGSVREAALRRGIHSAVVVPLHGAGATLGWLGVEALREPRNWPADAEMHLRTLADIFANALVRKRAAAELHQSEEMSGAVLKSIAAQVCVLGRDGRILAMNDAWRLSSGEPSGHLPCLLAGGRCPMEAGAPAPCAAAETGPMRDRIREALAGSRASFAAEYHSAAPTSDAWFLLTAEQLRTPEGGVVLSHQNVTARKRAELDAEQRRQELAHVSRVSTMGELAASIAHELNQPLTGVLSNAQAALRFLDADRPDLAEVREILTDIVEDDRRAGEVIRRLRAMLRKSAIDPVDLDVNEVIADVAKLLATDVTLRKVKLETSLSDGLPPVRADRIQLEQVVLNLVVNAMDAMRETPAEERRVMVRTVAFDASTVLVSVTDRGPGIDQDKLGRIFQPFFTTKPEGMGMGLSIARTIVEAHGGVLWAVNNPDRGASFHSRLPASSGGV